jgi:hypothetical protein
MLLNELPYRTVSDLDDDERWLAIQRIVDSTLFRKSPRLSQLLLYLAEKTLLDSPELLSEYQIAIGVFERESDFHPGVDTIVRSHMVRLRQRLDQYPEENRSAESVRVSIPKGEYSVRFDKIAATLPQPPIDSTDTHTVHAMATPRQSRFPLYLCGVLAAAVLILLGMLLVVVRRSHHPVAEPARSHPLWSHFFRPQSTTTFVAADSGLVMLHAMTGKDTTLAEYLSRDFSRETQGLSAERVDQVLNISNHRYTSFVDLNMFRRLEHLPYATTGRLEVKYARDIQMNDLKQSNVVLSGSRGANPWLSLYETGMNFVGQNDAVHHTYSFRNRNPLAGETSQFSVTEHDPQQRVLGVLAFLSNLDGEGNALIIEGNSIAGTEAISDFLFDDDALLPFLRKVTRPDGTLSHFEVLIESNSVNGSAGPFHILAYRIHP